MKFNSFVHCVDSVFLLVFIFSFKFLFSSSSSFSDFVQIVKHFQHFIPQMNNSFIFDVENELKKARVFVRLFRIYFVVALVFEQKKKYSHQMRKYSMNECVCVFFFFRLQCSPIFNASTH